MRSGSDGHYVGFESVAVYGTVAQFVAVGVNGVYTVVERMGHAVCVVDAEAHEGEYAEVAVERLAVGEYDLLVGVQEGVYFLHEVGIQVQE